MAEWKDIPGYEGLYQVSDEGEVKRIAGSPGCIEDRIIKWVKMTSGYPRVSLSKNGIVKLFAVHRLVLWTFIGDQGALWVNHKNGVKIDNRLENLEYMTPSENAQHACDTGLQPPRVGSGNGHSVLTEDQVMEIRKLYSLGVTRKELVKRFGVSKTAIRDVVTYTSWTHVR